MKRNQWLCSALVLIFLSSFLLFNVACGDDDDDSDSDGGNDDNDVGGVCYTECFATNVNITTCTTGFASDADCEQWARSHCEINDDIFQQHYFDAGCASCEDESCQAEWLEGYD